MPEPVVIREPAPELKSIQIILQTASFGAQKHASQKRKGAAAEPYINHLLEVAHLVSTALSRPDTNLIITAVLHDAIEDVGVSNDEIAARFGSDNAQPDPQSGVRCHLRHVQRVRAGSEMVNLPKRHRKRTT